MITELPGYCNEDILVPRVLCHSLTEVTEVPGEGMGISQNSQKFGVRVRKSFRTSRTSGHCGTGVRNSQKFRASTKHAVPVPRVLFSLTEVTEVPGEGMGILQNSRKFGVRVRKSFRTSGTSGHCGTGVRNSQKFRASTKHAVPVPRVLWPRAHITSRSSVYGYECRTELPEVPGTGMNVLQNLRKFFVG